MRKERARQNRKLQMIKAAELPDAQAAQVPTLYPDWRAGEVVKPGDRRYYPPTDKLYKVRDGQGHTTQADWTPDVTPTMWEVIDVEHAGTLDDPIPAAANMEYFKDKYYVEAGTVYRCTRDTQQPVSQLPRELVGVYFEAVQP